jgi:hypothetical protein
MKNFNGGQRSSLSERELAVGQEILEDETGTSYIQSGINSETIDRKL